MPIKGNAYVKTSWAFQERPVASAKLNTWDDRIEQALELAHRLLALAWGGGDGVIRNATADDLLVQATSPESLAVLVEPGYAFISRLPYQLVTQTQSADVSPPTTNPRIDLVQAQLETWDVSVKQGTEAASPTVPAPDTDAIPLAELFLRPGMTQINDIDDSTNGYIIDARTFL